MAGKGLKLREGWGRPHVVFTWAFPVGVFVFAFFVGGAQLSGALWLGGALVLGVAMACVARLVEGVWLEVTDTTVEARVSHDTQRMPRGDVRAIHYFQHMISFRDPGDEPAMMIKPIWSRRQMRKVARELEVPLFNHTLWFGLKHVHEGWLDYDPRAARPPAVAARQRVLPVVRYGRAWSGERHLC